ncbi:MAG: SAM-dependent chlorinase/fluorinase [Acidobacteriota bacterium]|nr:MAG: SAM-dependent chlorinase/fluorinase [Acidobacteriota bacterium]
MITLLTDFGLADYFVPAVRGVILSINPAVRIVDLTHEIPSQDLRAGSFILGACYREFPKGTIHLAVVDPGVGSERRPIIVESSKYSFVGPDNGIFSFVYAGEGDFLVYRITNDRFFRHPVSATFHGRDIFAPVAAHLSLGTAAAEIGERIADPVKFDLPRPRFDDAPGTIMGEILHIDGFGNIITSFTDNELRLSDLERTGAEMVLAGRRVVQFGSHFASAPRRDELFAYPGSAGYWEIALWCGSAAGLLEARIGDRVMIERKA